MLRQEDVRIGEGSLVSFAGFLERVEKAGKESVNCNLGGESLDIHIDLVERRNSSMRARG